MTATLAKPTQRDLLRSSALATGLLAVMVTGTLAQNAAERPDFIARANAQAAANAEPGPRHLPERAVPVPEGVSGQAKFLIAPSYSPFWNAVGNTAKERHAFEKGAAAAIEPLLADLRQSLGVTMDPATIGGVPVLILTPATISEERLGRTILNLHGGGYVYGSGVSGTYVATLMAAHSGTRVIAFDYGVPPDAPYPAAVDDAAAVWRALIGEEGLIPASSALNGTSVGGGLALAMLLRLKAEGLPMPGALVANTPWADLSGSGDSNRANEWLDNSVVSYDGYLDDAARIYANGVSLTDPEISPVFGDRSGLPPTLLISGTRDLFLSDFVRVQRKLRQAGVEADLQLFEAFSHAQYLFDAAAPETIGMMTEIAVFLDAHIGG